LALEQVLSNLLMEGLQRVPQRAATSCNECCSLLIMRRAGRVVNRDVVCAADHGADDAELGRYVQVGPSRARRTVMGIGDQGPPDK
jgi:hypothetical protein